MSRIAAPPWQSLGRRSGFVAASAVGRSDANPPGRPYASDRNPLLPSSASGRHGTRRAVGIVGRNDRAVREAEANRLGLTTQIPVRAVYVTSSPSRRLHFGALTVELRHAPRWELAAPVRAEKKRLHIGYEPLFEDSGFVRPEVVVEFGTRSTGEPRRRLPVRCDAAAYLPGLAFPQARLLYPELFR